jgi:hypothetical protein
VLGRPEAFTTIYSDAAKACSEAVTLAALAGNIGKFLAIKLYNGKSDGHVYDSKKEAVRFQLHEQLCCYVMVPPGGMTPAEAEIYLDFNRRAYDAGFRLADPDEVIPPIGRDEMRQKIRLLGG